MSSVNRRSRILGIQKTSLVQLAENHFIRRFGHHTNANFEIIDSITWEKFADVLNNLGPSKTATQWKACFNSMYNRVRNRVLLIHKSDAHPEDNLSEVDLKIYVMLPTVNYALLNEELTKIETKINRNFAGHKQPKHNCLAHGDTYDDVIGYKETESSDVRFEGTAGDDVDYDDREYVSYDDGESERTVIPFELFHRDNEYHIEIASRKVDPNRFFVASNEEELERYVNESIIVEDAVGDSMDEPICVDEDQYDRNADNERAQSVNRIIATDTHADTVTLPDNVTPPNTFKSAVVAKTSTRIPDIQKERLVQLVQNNFIKIVGRFAGADGAHIKAKLWAEIAKELNQLGPARTSEQWKAITAHPFLESSLFFEILYFQTFNAIKASAKAKLTDEHNNDNGTVSKSMNRLEEKVLAIYGLDSLDGDQRLGEAGFSYKKTVPLTRQSNASLQRPENRFNKSGSSRVNATITSGAFESGSKSPSPCPMPNENNSDKNFRRQESWNNELNRLGLAAEKVRPPNSFESSVLNEILREIREGTTDVQSDSVRVTPPTTASLSRNSASATGGSYRPALNSESETSDRTSRVRKGLTSGLNTIDSTNATRGSRKLSTLERTSSIAGVRENDRGRSNGRNVPPARVRYSNTVRANEENDDERTLVRPDRDRSSLRNRYTSYDMVQRSMQQQEYFIEQSGRNHAEMMYSSDRNHAEMIDIFNSTLKTLADVARDIFKKN